MVRNRDIDIIKNMKTIEWLKAELLTNMAYLHKTLVNNEDNTKENLEDAISNVILQTYILGKRLGLEFEDIDSALKENIKLNLIEEHKIEKWYGDLSKLLDYLSSR
ncbi:MazG-like family protein [Lachnospiraceae bacterium NSJ-29]|uniref:MazG-like family protein n=1 Tax=Wansuia hejianensis TaxID=2763667 RepID=A0A926ILQ2_9FIRM|nr:MazG-like family protein [Wansuia hejianensis]MBC8590384.1 MazG-like family protein [Wansuia hejianensis]